MKLACIILIAMTASASAQNQSQRGMAQPKEPTIEARIQRLERIEAERAQTERDAREAIARRSR
ncbi:MAG TPA: hypothetical protein VIM11_26830 [Tepidisphaeraceae bacterium]|jgi:outer membrane lipoprotein-sorting protein